MQNPMDKAPFINAPHTTNNDIQIIVQQARQNPRAFEDYIRRSNPQAYDQAMRIRNSPNPQAMIMQMAQSRGINPNILRMLGLM